MINCKICGKEFKKITNTHLKKEHSITMQEYMHLFPFAEMEDLDSKKIRSSRISASLKKTLSLMKKEGKHRKNWWDVATEEEQLKFKKMVSNRMKKNNPMKDPNVVKKVIATHKKNGAYERSSKRMLALWNNPEFRKESIARSSFIINQELRQQVPPE